MSKKDEKGAKDAKAKAEAKPKADKPKAAAPAKPKADAKGKGKGKDKEAASEEATSKAAPKTEQKAPPPRLRDKYCAEITPALMKRFAYKNVMQVPRLQKIIVNMGLGAAVQNPKLIDTAVTEMASIAGQKPVVTKAKKSIANFKIRQGMPIGVMVTLRRERMWEFLDRLVSISLPRVRDFRGISPRAFDGAGNYTLGLKEQIVFPEINFDKVEHTHGMNVTFVTSAKSNEEAKELLGMLGMPFRS